MFPIETTFVAHDNNEVLTVKLGHETSLVAYSTDKRSRGIFSRDSLPDKIYKKECGIINLDDIEGHGTHWVCYRNLEKNLVEYFDPFGLIMPYEIRDYLLTSRKKNYSQDETQNRETVLCVYWCLYYLNERQKGDSILDVIHNEGFDEDNSDFIKDCFINMQYL